MMKLLQVKKLKSLLFASVLILYFQNSLKSQEQVIDSLKTQLSLEADTLEQLKLLYFISYNYSYINVDSSDSYAQRMYHLSRVANNDIVLAMAYDRIGLVRQTQGEYQQSLLWHDSAIHLNKKIGVLDNELAAINNKAIAYRATGEDARAMKMYAQGLETSKSNDLPERVGNFTGNIAKILIDKGLYDSARYFYEQSLAYFQVADKPENEALILNSIGSSYHFESDHAKAIEFYRQAYELASAKDFQRTVQLAGQNIALIYKVIGDTEKAIEYSLSILESYRKSGLKVKEGSILSNIASLYEGQSLFKEAIDYGEMAIAIQESNDDKRLSQTYNILAKAHYSTGRKELGLMYAEKAKTTAKKHKDLRSEVIHNSFIARHLKEIGNHQKAHKILLETVEFLEQIELPELTQEIYSLLAEVSDELGQYKAAFKYQGISTVHLRELKNQERVNAVVRSAMEFDTERKEQELVQLRQESEIKDLQAKQDSFSILLLITGIVLLCLLVVIILLFARQKRRQLIYRNQMTQQKLLRVQLNPHFIFNALNAIQEFVFSEGNQRPSKFLSKFSRLMRQILENSDNEYIPLSREIEMLEDYLSLQNLRKNFKYKITFQEGMDIDFLAIPPMFAQPFVENAVEYGIPVGATDGEIHIHFGIENDVITLAIQDNGNGIKKTVKTSPAKHKSMATTITEERISILKDSLKKKIIFKVNELNPGTQVVFRLPYETL